MPTRCSTTGAAKRWLFAEAMDLSTGKGRLEVCELHDDGTTDDWLASRWKKDFHLSFPMVFDWNGEVWMIPETGSDHSLRLYRCKTFPTQWELVQRFPTDEELCDTILLDRRAEALTLLCSETRPDNQLYVRYRRYTLRHAVQETAAVPLPAEDTLPAAPGPFELCPMKPTICSTATLTLSAATPGRFSCWVSRSSTPPRSAPPWTTRGLSAVSRPPRQLGGASLRRHAAERRDHRPCPARTSSASTPTAAMTF